MSSQERRRSELKDIKYCTSCDKSTTHHKLDGGGVACVQCGHMLGRKIAPKLNPRTLDDQEGTGLHDI